MSVTWTPAKDALPCEGETVLLYLPDFAWPRPVIATLRKGDPNHPGAYYRADKWLCASILGIGSWAQPLKPNHLWTRIATPESVSAWHDARTHTEEPPTPIEPQPAPRPKPSQPALFETRA